GDVLGPIGGGLLWDVWGIAGVLITRIVLAAVTEVYAATMIWRRPAQPSVQEHAPPAASLAPATFEAPAGGAADPTGLRTRAGASAIRGSEPLK
ncbi:MAG TPA: hypothetical protein VE782_08005, partial [Myxococcaceae bacterium]|nr:hypothetical protein [Myxococcaceae bacterium]